MDKSNIIISIIIVLCVAAAVAAYGITNSDNPIFSDLSSMSGKTGNGLGNNTTLNATAVDGAGSGNDDTGYSSGSGSGTSSSGSGSGSSSGSGSGSGSGSSGSGGGGSGGGDTPSSTPLSYSEAQSIAASAIEERNCSIGSGDYSGGYWYFNVIDADGNVVDTISVNDQTGQTGRE